MSSAQALLVVLMLRVASPAARSLGADLVDAGKPVQEPAQRRVVARDVAERRRVAEVAREGRAHTLQCIPAQAVIGTWPGSAAILSSQAPIAG